MCIRKNDHYTEFHGHNSVALGRNSTIYKQRLSSENRLSLYISFLSQASAIIVIFMERFKAQMLKIEPNSDS